MTTDLWMTGGAILFLIVLSFLFSGTETGMTAASRARLHSLAAGGDARAAVVEPRRPGDPAEVVADPTRIAEALGWRATRTLEDILDSVVRM